MSQEGEEKTEAALKAQLKQQKHEARQLRLQLNEERRRYQMLESELQLTSDAKRKAEEAHARELQHADQAGAKAVVEMRALLEKLQNVQNVEDAVRELYIQMKDRVAEKAPDPVLLKAELRALRDENIMITIGKLQAVLRNLWVFKVESEADLRGDRAAHESRKNEQVGRLQEKVQQAHEDVVKAHEKRDSAEAAMRAAEAARDRAIANAQADIGRLGSLNDKIVAESKALTEENAHLKSLLRQSRQEGKRRDGLVLRNQQLESASHFQRVAQNKMLRSLQRKHQEDMTDIAHQNDAIPGLRSKVKKLEDELADYKSKYRSMSQGALKGRLQNLEDVAKRQSTQVDALRMYCKTLEAQLRRVHARSRLEANQADKQEFVWRAGKHIMADERSAAQKAEPDPILRHLVDIDEALKQPKELLSRLKQELKRNERLNALSHAKEAENGTRSIRGRNASARPTATSATRPHSAGPRVDGGGKLASASRALGRKDLW